IARWLALSAQPASAKLFVPYSMTPRSQGYRMPAEWEPQEAIWLSWPHNELTWPGPMLTKVERTYTEIIEALHTGQKIKLLVKGSDSQTRVGGLLKGHGVDLR